MSDFILLLLIIFLLLCLALTVGGLLVYSGLLSDVVVKTGAPPIRNVTIAYKFKEGAYKDSGAAFTETCSVCPKLKSIGIFYDDPRQRPLEKCRYTVGSILCEGEEKPDEGLLKLYKEFGFKVFSLPEVSHAVTTTFPCTTNVSYVLAPHRVYPRLSSYIEVELQALQVADPDLDSCPPPRRHQPVQQYADRGKAGERGELSKQGGSDEAAGGKLREDPSLIRPSHSQGRADTRVISKPELDFIRTSLFFTCQRNGKQRVNQGQIHQFPMLEVTGANEPHV